jgi:death-on-curing protein
MKTSGISIEEIEYVAYWLAKELMSFDEPIPDFDTRDPHKLEACAALPFQTWDKRFLYKGLIPKAAILFYAIIKDHPSQNGNKRIAVTTTLYFLYKNGRWLKIDNQELYNLARWVADSNPKVKNETVKAVERLLKTHLVKI